MFSHERPTGFRPRFRGQPSADRPPSNEETIKTETVQIERKTFVFTLKENPRGRFLRITEDVGGRRDAIIVPAPGLEEFRRVVEDMAKVAITLPEPSPATPQNPLV